MDELKKSLSHSVIMENRNKLTITGITDVGSFDEENMTVYSEFGEITVRGEKLQVSILNVETGQFCAEGKIISVQYSDRKTKNQSLFSKVFR